MSTNILQAVQTYQSSALGWLQNLFCGINTCNSRFKDFNTLQANLGDTVTFDLTPRMAAQPGLVVSNYLGVQQRVASLTVGAIDANGNQQAAMVPFAFTAQQLILNIDNNDYREKFETSAMLELGTIIETSILSTILNSPYRFYGNGTTPINSFGQLSQALAFWRNYGTSNFKPRGYLDDISIPAIVNSGLNQFVLKRNEEIFNSWEIGNFSNCDWYQSNLLPTHTSGNTGINQQTLTVVSIDPTGTLLTLSGATVDDANAVLANDLFQFQDVSGVPNIRFLTFIGHQPSASPVQVRAVAGAAANGSGDVTVQITPALISTPGDINQNITVPIQSGMQLLGLPSHRRGLISTGDAMFMAMPMLPDQYPFPTANRADEYSGASIRFTQGSTFGQNQTGFIFDAIWGSTFVGEYQMALIVPL